MYTISCNPRRLTYYHPGRGEEKDLGASSTSGANSRERANVRVKLCCAKAISNGRFNRYLRSFKGHVICTRITPHEDEIFVDLLAVDANGCKFITDHVLHISNSNPYIVRCTLHNMN